MRGGYVCERRSTRTTNEHGEQQHPFTINHMTMKSDNSAESLLFLHGSRPAAFGYCMYTL